MLLQVPALLRAGITSLPVQRHEFKLAEHTDWGLRLQARLKSYKGRDIPAGKGLDLEKGKPPVPGLGLEAGTAAQHAAVVARLQCKAAQELLDSRSTQVLMWRVHLFSQ